MYGPRCGVPRQSPGSRCRRSCRPSSRGNSAKRTFFVNQSGDILSTTNTAPGQLYNGELRPPAATAAFANGTRGNMASTIASNTSGLDNGIWTVVN